MSLEKRSSYRIVRSVLFALILREMRGRFGARRFGVFWVFFEPAAQIALYMALFAFRNVSVRSGIEFPLFLMSGMIPFFMMRNIALRSMGAIDANRALFAYKQIKPFDTLLARSFIEVIIYISVYFIFMLLLGLFFGYDVSIHDPLRWIATLSVGLIFSFALGLLFCIITDALPDLRSFIRILFFPIYLLSGVLYPIWILPANVLEWFLWNPYVHIIDELRMATFPHYPQHEGVNIFYPFKVAVFLLLISLALYRIRRFKLVAI